MSGERRYGYRLDAGEDSAKGRVVRLVGRDKKVLEVGCASGAMSQCMAEQFGCRITGLEINPEDAAEARAHCEALYVGNVEEIDLVEQVGSAGFDVAVYADVLEHLRDPVAALRKTRAVLKAGGYVVACVPNIAHAALAYELALGKFEYRRVGLLDDTHIHFFTKGSLLRTFEAAGYAVVSLDRYIAAPRHTEFDVTPRTPAERELLQRLLDAHPESQTYQFIVKAMPLDRELDGMVHVTSAFQASISDLEGKLEAAAQDKRRLESELAWVNNRWPMRLMNRVRRLVS